MYLAIAYIIEYTGCLRVWKIILEKSSLHRILINLQVKYFINSPL